MHLMRDGNDGIKGQTAGPKETTLCNAWSTSVVSIFRRDTRADLLSNNKRSSRVDLNETELPGAEEACKVEIDEPGSIGFLGVRNRP